MAVDFTKLQANMAALVKQVAATKTVEGSAILAFQGQQKTITDAVNAALAADDSVTQETVDSVNQAIADSAAQFQESAADLGAAIPANTPPAPPPPPLMSSQ